MAECGRRRASTTTSVALLVSAYNPQPQKSVVPGSVFSRVMPKKRCADPHEQTITMLHLC